MSLLPAVENGSHSTVRSTDMSYRGKGGGNRGSNTRFTGKRGSYRGGRGGSSGSHTRNGDSGLGPRNDRITAHLGKREDDGTALQERFEEVKTWDEIDEKLGFARYESGLVGGGSKVGWLVNMHQVSLFIRTSKSSSKMKR